MKFYHKNPRAITEKQFANLRQSLPELGDLGGIVHDLNSDEVIGGNQRVRAMGLLGVEPVIVERYDPPNEQGTVAVGYYEVNGEQFKYRAVLWTPRQCEKANVIANRAGGSWDFDTLANDFEMDDLLDWGFDEGDLVGWDMGEDLLGVPKDAQPSPRDLPIDAIYTATFPASCCLAVAAGLKYGIQSGKALCPCANTMGGHKLAFIDCDYAAYNHQKHAAACQEHRPQYATVRDYMSREQCTNADIAFYDFQQILDWAADIEQYAEHVIIIPKVDILDQVPERYLLGYSVPTSHGGTSLPVEAFRGRRVHLLGGSWKAQLAHMAALGDDVVSFDNNYLGKIAQMGGAVLPDGTRKDLPAYEIDTRVNPAYIALAISLGNVGWKVNELYKNESEQAAGPAPIAETERAIGAR